MIKIIKGVYGVMGATSKTAPFTLSKDEEARLVSLGVAAYVDAPETEAPAEAEAVAPIVEAPAEAVKKATKKGTKKAKK